MKIEKLSDLLEIDTDNMKALENKRLLTRIKQLLKNKDRESGLDDEEAEGYPHEAVSVVGNKYVTLRFDLKTKKARVVDTNVDSRDSNGRNFMAGASAVVRLKEIVKEQNKGR